MVIVQLYRWNYTGGIIQVELYRWNYTGGMELCPYIPAASCSPSRAKKGLTIVWYQRRAILHREMSPIIAMHTDYKGLLSEICTMYLREFWICEAQNAQVCEHKNNAAGSLSFGLSDCCPPYHPLYTCVTWNHIRCRYLWGQCV